MVASMSLSNLFSRQLLRYWRRSVLIGDAQRGVGVFGFFR